MLCAQLFETGNPSASFTYHYHIRVGSKFKSTSGLEGIWEIFFSDYLKILHIIYTMIHTLCHSKAGKYSPLLLINHIRIFFLLVSQCIPSYKVVQLHLYPFTRSTQLPLFKQDVLLKQSSISVKCNEWYCYIDRPQMQTGPAELKFDGS